MNIKQKNLFGKNEVNHYLQISIDIFRLQDILHNEKEKINILLNNLTNNNQNPEIDNSSISIFEKNKKNNIVNFYNKFIKHKEQELDAIQEFIVQNDLSSVIDNASENLRFFIFSYENKEDDKLDSQLLNILIQEHTKNLIEEDKDLMILLIYFLYRVCYIGDK